MIRKWAKKNKNLILVTLTILAAVINAFSVKNFINELNLVPLGVPGISIIVQKFINYIDIKIEYYYIFLLLNSILLIWCYISISKSVAWKSLLYVIIFTIASKFLPHINVTNDKFINIMSGAVSNAASSLLLIFIGSSVGGFNIIGIYYSKKNNKSMIGFVNNISNVLIICIFVVVSSIESAIASLIIAVVSSLIVDRYHNQSNYVMLMIVTNKQNLIMEYATEKLQRTGTLLDSIGSYSRKNNNTFMLNVSRTEYRYAIKDIRKLDPNVHITILRVEGIKGNMKSQIGESAI